ncbi:MAG: hypothetical protein ACFFB3_02265, partial [Candidatus Hodarchaeota archaeon]
NLVPALPLYFARGTLYLEDAPRYFSFNLFFIDEGWLDVDDFWQGTVGLEEGDATIAMICWIVALLAGIVAIILHFIANREPAGLLYIVSGLVDLVSLYLWWNANDQYVPIPVGALVLLYVGFRVYQGER